MLIFFDIDATLIHTSRSGMHAMHDAGRELFGEGFRIEGINFAGRLDPLILHDMLSQNGQAVSDASIGRMVDRYRAHLARRLAQPGVGRALPGVMELLAALREKKGVTLALLTGNFADTGQMKLRACGIDPEWFSIRVWGDESPHSPPARQHLPPVGLKRFEERHGRRLSPDRAVIIGDTPHDIACARAHGLRSIGVATGTYSVAQLQEAQADWAVPNLSDTRGILDWLGAPAR